MVESLNSEKIKQQQQQTILPRGEAVIKQNRLK